LIHHKCYPKGVGLVCGLHPFRLSFLEGATFTRERAGVSTVRVAVLEDLCGYMVHKNITKNHFTSKYLYLYGPLIMYKKRQLFGSELIRLFKSGLFGNLFQLFGDPDFNNRLPRHTKSFGFPI